MSRENMKFCFQLRFTWCRNKKAKRSCNQERSLQSQSERPISASKRGGGPVGKWHATGQRAVKKRVREQSGRKKKPANKRARSQAKKAQRLSSLRH
ncbi:hypothetical protein T4C_4531 [Trichinella pseudospiralis]|uniref:Uncharacterized protein n=1 Tax=Trichinella pseudospiralis TaxID=6337 RepID=A0A0V1FW91_TRIPS|nr:hypothetical protein T4D_10626 [Trichinella pseudospiralis]KRZ39097.1 hypothetical protein T4C_4531 [Trichinella pseudospiralis]